MWTLLAVGSSFLLGLYDAAKKQALKKNGVIVVLLVATALSTLFVSPFLRLGPWEDHLRLAFKALLVTASWISGMVGLKLLPLTTVSMLKGSRPLFVVLFSIVLYGEVLSWMQWAGVLIVLAALYMLGRTSRGDAPAGVRKSGFIWMGISILTGVASALYDKHIMHGMEPLFVQSWTNLYITILLGIALLISRLTVVLPGRESPAGLRFAHPSHCANACGPLPSLRDVFSPCCPPRDICPKGWPRAATVLRNTTSLRCRRQLKRRCKERSDTGGIGGYSTRAPGGSCGAAGDGSPEWTNFQNVSLGNWAWNGSINAISASA